MQANSNNHFLNLQIFAGLLKCIHKICMERFIGHLAIVDIEDVRQLWFRDFFRLAGFRRCHCQTSDGDALQLETWNCLALRESLDPESSIAFDKFKVWLAEGRCTEALLLSIASGKAAEVERKHFHDLLAEAEKEGVIQAYYCTRN